MTNEEIYNYVRMICGSLLMVGMFMIPSCEDNRVEEEVSLEPMMQLWVNGDYIDPYTYYAQINTYGKKTLGEDGKIKKSSKTISLKPKIFLEFDGILKLYENNILLNNK